jgi:IS605 OrfB family transposase
MRLTAVIQLLPDEAQAQTLLDTIRAVNAACNYASQVAFEQRAFRRKTLHTLVYREIRTRFGLPAQLAVHVINRVVDTYKAKGARKAVHTFKEFGAVRYDSRVLSLKPESRTVSISTFQGRVRVPFAAGEPQLRLLQRPVRELTSWLAVRKGKFYLAVVCEVDDPESIDPEGVLGVDLGQVNLAADSTGERFSGENLARVRLRYARLRRRLQKRGTQSAKRHLRKLSRKEHNFATTMNHTVAKRVVEKARRHRAAIVLENLKGIRTRTTVQKGRRPLHHGWPFRQLQSFIAYKAALAGVPVLFVEPQNTSRTCPVCGHIDRRNRRSQSEFVCRSCGFSDHADRVAAVNIAARAAVNRPVVGWHGLSPCRYGKPSASADGS